MKVPEKFDYYDRTGEKIGTISGASPRVTLFRGKKRTKLTCKNRSKNPLLKQRKLGDTP